MSNDEEFKSLHLDEDTIKNMRATLTDRVAIIVIQAIYTVTDAAYDYPSKYAIESLISPAVDLKNLAISGRIGFKDIQLIAICLEEAETLLRATRQRLSGLPQTREASRLPFELPPPSVKMFIESCEYVVKSIVEMFDKHNFYQNYVIIDTVDSPKHNILAIRVPEHRLKEIAVYLALSHEAFHGFIHSIFDRFMENAPSVKSFVENGRIISYYATQREKLKIIAEILVEILDLEFSYLGNFKRYMEDEWTFFSQYIAGSPKLEVEPLNVIHYFLRTFVTRLWFYLNENGDDTFISSSNFRILIRAHAEQIEGILKDDFPNLISIISASLILTIQKDVEENYAVFIAIFAEISSILDDYQCLMKDLKEYFQSEELKKLTDLIVRGEVIDEFIQYPHLLVQAVAKRIKEYSASLEDRKKLENMIIMPMIMGLWNAKNKERTLEINN